MAKRQYEVVEEDGVIFFFAYDRDDPTQLHIYVRHLTDIDDALNVYFEAEEHRYNPQNKRFESFNESHGLYWFWLNEEERKIMVITCFELKEARYET